MVCPPFLLCVHYSSFDLGVSNIPQEAKIKCGPSPFVRYSDRAHYSFFDFGVSNILQEAKIKRGLSPFSVFLNNSFNSSF